MVTYGGDEVSAVVVDIGTNTTRAGYAGEESPKLVIPTSYGYINVSREVDDEEDTASAPVTKENVVGADQSGDGDVEMTPAEGSSTTLPTPSTQDQDPRVSPTASGSAVAEGMTGAERKKKVIVEKRYFMGEDGVNVWRKGMEVGSFMSDGIIADPAPLPSHLHHILHSSSGLHVDPSSHPILFTEPAWNTPAAREVLAEILFEGEGGVGGYWACSSVLSAFSAGKGSALVVDIGTDLCSVVPISDGFALRSGTKRQPLSLTLLNAQIAAELSNISNVLIPHHLIKSRKPVPPGNNPDFVPNQARLDGTTDSWREWATGKVVEGWREGVAEVNPPDRMTKQPLYKLSPAPEMDGATPRKSYEFPNGFNKEFGDVRYRLPEILFNPNSYLNRSLQPPTSLLAIPSSPTSYSLNQITSLSDLITTSILSCDIDQRPLLLQNIVIVGGGSFIPGLVSRVDAELAQRFPGSKVRIHNPGNSVERRFSAWLGGSILASLGTFHQLWVSADEWKEHGPSILRQRCK